MLTTVSHCKKMNRRVRAYFQAHVAWIMVAFNLLAQWVLEVNDHKMIHLSIAYFSI